MVVEPLTIEVADGEGDFVEPSFAFIGEDYPDSKWAFTFRDYYFGPGIRITSVENLTEHNFQLNLSSTIRFPAGFGPFQTITREPQNWFDNNVDLNCIWEITPTTRDDHGDLVNSEIIIRINYACELPI